MQQTRSHLNTTRNNTKRTSEHKQGNRLKNDNKELKTKIQELQTYIDNHGCVQSEDDRLVTLQLQDESSDICGFLKSFFDIKHVKKTLAVVFKKRPHRRRTKFILILACIVLIHGPQYGEYTVNYLFTRYRFNWDALKFSFYSTFYICIHAFGVLISISLFSRRLKWHDSVLGLISNCSNMVGCLAISRATTSLDMYVAVVLAIFSSTSHTALRSVATKLVTSDELGKMTSLYNMIEMLSFMVFGSIYSWIYKETIASDAGTVFYVSTAISIPTIIIFAWFFMEYKRDDSSKEEDDDSNEEENINAKDNMDMNAGKESLLSSIDMTDIKI